MIQTPLRLRIISTKENQDKEWQHLKQISHNNAKNTNSFHPSSHCTKYYGNMSQQFKLQPIPMKQFLSYQKHYTNGEQFNIPKLDKTYS